MSGPGTTYRTVDKLRFYTEDRAPENYLVLRSKLGANRQAVAADPRAAAARTAPRAGCRATRCRCRTLTTSLEIDKRALKARLSEDGERIWTLERRDRRPATPTPSGRFWIRERLRNLGGNAAYGPLAFGTAAYSRLSDWPGGGVVGIHGTNAPGLIPGRPSHGCVRVPNRKIMELKALMPVGTPVWIHD